MFDHECDDGNVLDGDGCSSDCKFEEGFRCSLTFPTVCVSEMVLEFRVMGIMKNKDNSAEMIVGLRRQSIPFELS